MPRSYLYRLAVVLIFAAPLVVPLSQSFASSGCCLKRDGGSWAEIGSDFDLCDQLNSADGDDIFEPSGQFWWSIDC